MPKKVGHAVVRGTISDTKVKSVATGWFSLVPGLAVAMALGWASIWLAGLVGVTLLGFARTPISPVMLAIVLGLVLRASLPFPKVLKPGIDFSVKRILRLGIILLGFRLSVLDVFRLGVFGIPIVLVCIVAALLITTRITRICRLPERLGTLIAVGTSICGVSAIVAAAPAVGAEEDEVAYAVAVITVFGLVATMVYPAIAHLVFGGQTVQAGLFLGTSVHDTSQVVGAAKIYADLYSAPRVLDTATVTKLVRNVFMVGVIPLMSLRYSRRTERGALGGNARVAKLVPLFILGFLLMAVVRSVGDAGISAGGNAFGWMDSDSWANVHVLVTTWAENLLVVALAAVGLSTSMRAFRGTGWKPFFVGLGAAVAVGLVSFGSISIFGSFVTL